jgi:hypothetical protein
MLGTTGIESCDSKKWMHSRWGFEVLEDSSYIGDLYDPSRDQEWLVRLAGSSTAGFSDESWTLVKNERLSNTTNRYEFQNPKFLIKLDLASTEWIGKHYILSQDNVKYRLYTNCTMLDSTVVQWRKELIDDFEVTVEGAKKDAKKTVEYPSETKSLPLVIKRYNFKEALSQKISESLSGSKWNIQGPVVSNHVSTIFN